VYDVKLIKMPKQHTAVKRRTPCNQLRAFDCSQQDLSANDRPRPISLSLCIHLSGYIYSVI